MNENEINIDVNILNKIKDIKKISVSYIQRTFSVGFNKANKIYKELVELKYVNTHRHFVCSLCHPRLHI